MYDILGYIDNRIEKQGKIFEGNKIYNPEILNEIVPDKIVVMTNAYEEIYNQICKYFPHCKNIVENKNFFYKQSIIARYKESTDPEICEVLDHIKQNGLEVFNYPFTSKYKDMDVQVFWDNACNLFYVNYKGHKMYMSRKFKNEKEVAAYYKSVLMEQDEDSPHKYLTKDFNVENSDVVVDVGVAEGNFSLDIIDRVKKIYLIETDERLIMERPGGTTAMRIVDLISPIGKGQRGMIVSPPKAGKTTLLKDVAKSILKNNKDMHLIILLIDERPEEVTDIREAIQGPNVEVIYSTFDELPEHHKRVSEMVVERARRLVEHKQDVVILLDSITRLARAYNLVVPPSGRTLSGGLDPGALHMPKRFFGAARNMREGGSLTILATALVDTGSKMDDVIYEEFKGTGNMELVLDRKLQEKRVFPAIDIQKSGTRREDLLLSKDEQEAVYIMRKALNGMKSDEAVEQILNMFARTANNAEFVQMVKKQKL